MKLVLYEINKWDIKGQEAIYPLTCRFSNGEK